MKKAWWKEAVVYQVYPRSFMDSNGDGVGDLRGIIQRLDYIQRLGANVIWLNPIYRSPNDDNGYDISDYRAIMDEFGTMEDFDELLAEAHKRGIRILMDLVVNHTSDEMAWFVESRKSRENPYRDYYIWREGKDGRLPNNWGSCFSGPAWKKDETTGEYYLHLFSTKQPDLNWENPKVRQGVYDMMRFWLDKGVDGFRMDVINFISKEPGLPDGPREPGALYGDFTPHAVNGPRVHEFLKEMNREVLARYDVMTVGETPGVTPEDARRYAGEDQCELNMIFQFAHMGLDYGPLGKWSLNRIRLDDLRRCLSRWQTSLNGSAWNSLYWNNHDQPRVVSRFGCTKDEESRVRSAKMLAVCLYLMQGTPYIYQGEELGMTNKHFDSIDPINDVMTRNAYFEKTQRCGESVADFMKAANYISREHTRTPMHWDDTANAGFTTGTPWIPLNPNYPQINAAKQVGDPDSVYSFYRRLLALRKSDKTFVYGHYALLLPDDEEIYAYTRTLNDEQILVVCNFTDHDVPCPLLNDWQNTELLISNYNTASNPGSLRPFEAVVYRK